VECQQRLDLAKQIRGAFARFREKSRTIPLRPIKSLEEQIFRALVQ
jgi:hypothetical protein